jgi:hypothetical protein
VKGKLSDIRGNLYKRFQDGRHVGQSVWIPDQFKAIDQEMNESNPDYGRVADAPDRLKRVLDLLGD